MFTFLLLTVFGVVVWKKVVPGSPFVDLFAMLLEHPERGCRGPFGWVRGIEHVGGEYEGRPVTLVMHYKRGEYRMGFLTLGMATSSAQSLRIESGGWAAGLSSVLEIFTNAPAGGDGSKVRVRATDANAAAAWLARADVKNAVDAMVGHGLSLAVEGGWLRATWMPAGFFIFPGRFEVEKWRDVLGRMATLAMTLDEPTASQFQPSRLSQGGAAHLSA